MNDFVVLFVPIFVLGLIFLGVGFGSSINIFVNIATLVFGIICMIICAFALLVQYVNWKYYKE